MTKLISDTIEERLQFLVGVEYNASHIYKYFEQECDKMGLKGAEKWYKEQYKEEEEHMQKVVDYIQDRNCNCYSPSLPSLKEKITSFKQVLDKTYEQEVKVEKAWKDFAILCQKEQDYTSFNLAMSFLGEQVDEIATVVDFIAEYDTLTKSGCESLAISRINELMNNR